MKFPITEEDGNFSRWAESIQKDIKCAFGILKRCFRILNISIPLQSINAVDQIWKTCCALHNWLLKIDGLDGEWYGAGCGDNEENTSVPVQLQCLSQGICVRESCAGDEEQNAGTQTRIGTFNIDPEGVNVVRLLLQNKLCAKLVIYLNIAWAKKEVKWPVKGKY